MTMRAHPRAAAILSFVVLAGLAAPAFASSPFAPPPPPDEAAAPAVREMRAPSPLDQFRQALQPFGSFHTHPLYGEAWKPSEQVAPAGWSPYPICHWQYDRQQRTWTFADPTEWGAIVHHYGRWANDPQHGWIWIADANYGPGWVTWRTEAGQVSWAPLLPEQHGNQPPRDGWQSQDQASFNSGCRQSPPPAPLASFAPPPAAAPAPPMIAHGGPAFVPGRPVFVPGHPILVPGRPPIFVPGRPPVIGGRPICAVRPFALACRPPRQNALAVPGIRDRICAVNPSLPACRGPGAGGSGSGRPRPVHLACHVNPTLPFCPGGRPGSAGGRPPGTMTPGPLGSICGPNPAHPACRPNARPFAPGPFVGRPGPRPGPFTGRPGPRPGIFVGRPGPHRPFVGRPGPHRPFVGRFGGAPRLVMGGGLGQRFGRR